MSDKLESDEGKRRGCFLKKRKGSLMLVLVFAFVIAIVMTAAAKITQASATLAKDSATMYESIQYYRSAAEIACWAYVNELQTVTVTKDLEADWLSSYTSMFAQAINSIQDVFADTSYTGDGYKWNKTTTVDALTGVPLSNSVFLADLISKFTSGNQSFSLVTPVQLEVAASNDFDDITHGSGRYVISPFLVEVDIRALGEDIHEKFYVSNLVLELSVATTPTGVASRVDQVTFRFTTDYGGIRISRNAVVYDLEGSEDADASAVPTIAPSWGEEETEEVVG